MRTLLNHRTMGFITLFGNQANIWVAKLKSHFRLHEAKIPLRKMDVLPNFDTQISDPARILTDGAMEGLCSRRSYIYSNIFQSCIPTCKQKLQTFWNVVRVWSQPSFSKPSFTGRLSSLWLAPTLPGFYSSSVSFFYILPSQSILLNSIVSLTNHVCRENI